MAKSKEALSSTSPSEPSVGTSELARALIQAIDATKPVLAKNIRTRKPNTPWTPKDGSPKVKLKRLCYQHGLLIEPTRQTNDVLDLLNQLRPGNFCNGYVKVIRRRDKGIDIDYPIKTASQRLRLVNEFGIRNFKELLQRCITESQQPKKDAFADDLAD